MRARAAKNLKFLSGMMKSPSSAPICECHDSLAQSRRRARGFYSHIPCFPRAMPASGMTRNRRELRRLALMYLDILPADEGQPLPATRQRIESANEIVVRAAYHEAGHAVVGCHLLHQFPLLATIARGSEFLDAGWGFVRWERDGILEVPRGVTPKDHAARYAQFTMAGNAVEEVREPGSADLEDLEYNDGMVEVREAFEQLSAFEPSRRRRWRWMSRLWESTLDLVQSKRIKAAIEQVAEALLNEAELDQERLHRLLVRLPLEPY